MEQVVREVNTAALMEEYCALMREVEQLPLLVSGRSMVPFLVHGRDTVYLTKITKPLKRGDMVLYRREGGAYILHRIYAKRGDVFDMVGDAQTEIESGITREQIFAVVCSAVRKGRTQKPGCFWWEFFEKIWIRLVPLRPILAGGYRRIKPIIRRIV